jgi:putative ABC transport system permease protein
MNYAVLVAKNLGRRKLRTALMLIAIFIAFLLFGGLQAFLHGFNVGESTAAADRLVSVNKINFTVPLPISYLERVKGVKGVVRAIPQSWFGGYFQDQKNVLFMFATNPEDYVGVYPNTSMPDAQRAAWIADRIGLAVGRVTAEKYGWKVGQHVPISSNIFSRADGSHTWEFNIDAIYSTPDSNREGLVLMSHKYFEDTVTFAKDTTSMIVFTTAAASLNDGIEKTIDAMFANSPYETSTDTAAAFNKQFVAQLGNITLIVTLVVSTAFAAILLIVGNTMVMAVRERTREIGVLKTLGFSGASISMQVLAESLLLALGGALLGLGAAAAVLNGMRRVLEQFIPGVSVTGPIFAAGLGLALLLGLVTGAIPAWSGLRLRIVTALGRH